MSQNHVSKRKRTPEQFTNKPLTKNGRTGKFVNKPVTLQLEISVVWAFNPGRKLKTRSLKLGT